MVCVRMEGLARMFRAYMRTTHHVRHCCAQNADHLAHGSPLSAFFAEVVCSLAATPPPVGAWPTPNGGNGVIRGTTRRRHAASDLLVLQNPHRHWCGGCRRDRGARLRCPWAVAGPGWAIHSDPAPLVWRAPEGPEGTGGLRDRPLRAAGSRVAISRAAGPDGARNTRGATSNTINWAKQPGSTQQRARSAAAPRAPRVCQWLTG